MTRPDPNAPVLVDVYTGWSADPNDSTHRQYEYESPWQPGDRLLLVQGASRLEATVVRTDGYAPGVVEFEYDLRVDLVGWTVQRTRPMLLDGTPCPDHKLVQHRDRRPPWCKTCRLTALLMRVPEPTKPAAAEQPAEADCPDCEQGKHGACVDQAWDDDAGMTVPCACAAADHRGATR